MLEAVINIAEGRDRDRLRAIGAGAGPALLDVHTDADHHRSVFTLADPRPGATEAAVRRLVTVAVEDLDLREHTGVHPRFGIVDVVPFVALDPTPPDVAVAAAHAFADWLARVHAIPSFFYDAADPQHRSLPDTRRDAFGPRLPDLGPATPHPSAGAVAVGARDVLVAINVNLGSDDLDAARAIATAVRARDGGLPGVRSLGFALAGRAQVQVSMNLVDLGATGIEAACTTVRKLAADRGITTAEVELVGLVPAAEFGRLSPEFRDWSGLEESMTIEARLARRPRAI